VVSWQSVGTVLTTIVKVICIWGLNVS